MSDILKLISVEWKDNDSACGFVFSAMRDCMRDQHSDMPDNIYYKRVGREIAELLKDRATSIKILTYIDLDCEGEYLGFVVTRGDELVYVYVKSQYRGSGLSKYMLEGARIARVGKYKPISSYYERVLARYDGNESSVGAT
jgi:hypothetical protein